MSTVSSRERIDARSPRRVPERFQADLTLPQGSMTNGYRAMCFAVWHTYDEGAPVVPAPERRAS